MTSTVIYCCLILVQSNKFTSTAQSISTTTTSDECSYETIDESLLMTLSNEQNISNTKLLSCRFKKLPKTFPLASAKSVENLKIICDKLFVANGEGSKSSSFFDSFENLRNLFLENCDGNFLRHFSSLKSLNGLTIRNYRTFWGRYDEVMDDFGASNDYEPFDNLQNIKSLDISANGINELHRNFFCDFHKLSFLNVSSNQIYNLTNFQFSSTPIKNCVFSMSYLILTANQLNFLPFSFFSNFVNLKVLRLNRNSISFIENFVFSNLKQLDMLDLSENKIQSIQPELFDNLQNLRTLNLEKNSMKILPPELLTNLKKLELLNLSSNFLSSNWINFMTFKNLFNLRLLDLSYNKLTALENSIFADLTALEVLDLKNNLIESIAMDTFANLSALSSLVLSHNFIKNVNFSLNSLTNLNVLSLDFNEIYSVEKHLVANSMKLVDLHLNDNKFFRVPNFVENFQFLKFLDLGENFIKNLSDLENLPNLKYLYGLRLTENQIETLEKNHFVHLKNLQIVNLSKNRIRHIEREAFAANEFLQAIRLDGNSIKNIDYMFENLTQLVFLNISENALEVFDYENFPKNLQFLDISKNQINVIKNPNEISQNLKTLNLNYNHLTEISAFVLPRNLEDLYLQSNLIEKISPYTFIKKSFLKTVDLKHNKIAHLNENALRISSTKSDEKLPEFHLAGNPLVCDCHLKWMWQDNIGGGGGNNVNNAIAFGSIENPEQFPYLLEEQINSDDTRNYPSYAAQKMDDFDNNYPPIMEQHNHVDGPRQQQQFGGAPNGIRTQPKIIDFDQMTCSFGGNGGSKIPIRKLNPNLFLCKYTNVCMKSCQCCENFSCDCQQKCPDRCNCYHNTNWDVNFVNCSAANYSKALPNLIPMEATHLHLDGNHFEMIKDFSFIGRRALRILYLNHSHIQQLTNRTFFGLKHLELLSLKSNELRQLNGDEFNELESVKYLFLQYNHIKFIERKQFVLLRALQVLKLNGNMLMTIDVQFLPQNIAQVDISENLLECDCELIKSIKVHEAIDYRDSLKCHPNQTYHEYFFVMNETNFCNEKLALENIFFFEKNLPIFLIVFLCCLFLIVLVFIFNQRIMFCCYKKFNLRFFKKRNDKNKFFDGFLVFSKKDENFLIDEFLKHFETEGNYYKFFLFFHDFSIFNEQILKNCENSQKIVLFLSENFLKNEWKKIEFKKIFYEILKTKKRKKLIIVFLDNFDNKNFDPELKLILKTNFILKWSEKLFWEKFKFFLPSLNRNAQLQAQQQQPSAHHDPENFCQNFHLNNLHNNHHHPSPQRNLTSIHI
jgi:Leucine-rich repeat (LRR) protein